MLESPITGIDFETCGYSRYKNTHPMEIGMATLHPNGEIEVIANSLISGSTFVSYHAGRTHGISLRDCWEQPEPDAFWPVIQKASLLPLCAHCIPTERKILREFFPIANYQWIDTLKLTRRLFPNAPNHKLETITTYLGKDKEIQKLLPQKSWHSALFDAVASLFIIQAILEESPHFMLKDVITHPHKPEKQRLPSIEETLQTRPDSKIKNAGEI